MSIADWQDGITVENVAFFLDVDGTLLGFKDRPQDVIADDDLRRLLSTLQTAAGGAVALVSGRTIADLDRIMFPLRLLAAGTHGAEIRGSDGRIRSAGGEALAALRPAFEAFIAERPGLLLEDKGAAFAIHYRLAPQRHDEVIAFVMHQTQSQDLMVQEGKMVAEVKTSHSSKGSAITSMMGEPPFAGRTPLFVGDDLTDEHGFAIVNKLNGVSIRVSLGEATVAHHRLADVDAVRRFLSRICSNERRS